jgi:hypothetical protein
VELEALMRNLFPSTVATTRIMHGISSALPNRACAMTTSPVEEVTAHRSQAR